MDFLRGWKRKEQPGFISQRSRDGKELAIPRIGRAARIHLSKKARWRRVGYSTVRSRLFYGWDEGLRKR
jgi:hypothetical protein